MAGRRWNDAGRSLLTVAIKKENAMTQTINPTTRTRKKKSGSSSFQTVFRHVCRSRKYVQNRNKRKGGQDFITVERDDR